MAISLCEQHREKAGGHGGYHGDTGLALDSRTKRYTYRGWMRANGVCAAFIAECPVLWCR